MPQASRAVIIFAICFALVSGRATVPKTATTGAPSELRSWQASGRIAVSGAKEGGSGSFTWRQQGADAVVQLHGPIGIGSLRIAFSDTALRVETGDGQLYVADDAETELAERLGANVPAQDLRYWMVGVAAPGDHQWLNPAEGATLIQHDWRIDYQRFDETTGVRLPTKFIATSGSAKVRIVIDRWSVK